MTDAVPRPSPDPAYRKKVKELPALRKLDHHRQQQQPSIAMEEARKATRRDWQKADGEASMEVPLGLGGHGGKTLAGGITRLGAGRGHRRRSSPARIAMRTRILGPTAAHAQAMAAAQSSHSIRLTDSRMKAGKASSTATRSTTGGSSGPAKRQQTHS